MRVNWGNSNQVNLCSLQVWCEQITVTVTTSRTVSCHCVPDKVRVNYNHLLGLIDAIRQQFRNCRLEKITSRPNMCSSACAQNGTHADSPDNVRAWWHSSRAHHFKTTMMIYSLSRFTYSSGLMLNGKQWIDIDCWHFIYLFIDVNVIYDLVS